MKQVLLHLKNAYKNRIVMDQVDINMRHVDSTNIMLFNDYRKVGSIGGCMVEGMEFDDMDCCKIE